MKIHKIKKKVKKKGNMKKMPKKLHNMQVFLIDFDKLTFYSKVFYKIDISLLIQIKFNKCNVILTKIEGVNFN